MNRILVPLDGSPKSLIAINHVKATFSPKFFEIVLLMVHENKLMVSDKDEIQRIQQELESKVALVAKNLEQYSVILKTAIGKPGQRIVECASEMGVAMILITKSTKVNHGTTIGMTASYVIRHAGCNVLVVQDRTRETQEDYRGLVYRKAEGKVNLRGALTLKQSECLLPAVSGRAVYRIQVIRGSVRFLHRAYNSDTRAWNLPPVGAQSETCDISAGETKDILVRQSDGDVPDRIRVVNRDMKAEAVFYYQIRKENSLTNQ